METNGDPQVRVSGVSKWFRSRSGTVHALDAVDLEVGRGEFLAVIGPSGCGKSTLLRVVAGLETIDAGRVTIEGDEPSMARRRKRFGLVPQTPALLPWLSVRRNIELLERVNRGAADHPPLDAERRREVLATVGLDPFLDSLPGELSGGLQQRVALVRAFVLDAPVLLMDEPFSALDEITRSEMRFLLLKLWQRVGSTVIFVTHSISEAVILADRVVVMSSRPGQVVEEIPVELSRPRTRPVEDSSDFHAVESRVRAALRSGWAA